MEVTASFYVTQSCPSHAMYCVLLIIALLIFDSCLLLFMMFRFFQVPKCKYEARIAIFILLFSFVVYTLISAVSTVSCCPHLFCLSYVSTVSFLVSFISSMSIIFFLLVMSTVILILCSLQCLLLFFISQVSTGFLLIFLFVNSLSSVILVRPMSECPLSLLLLGSFPVCLLSSFCK